MRLKKEVTSGKPFVSRFKVGVLDNRIHFHLELRSNILSGYFITVQRIWIHSLKKLLLFMYQIAVPITKKQMKFLSVNYFLGLKRILIMEIKGFRIFKNIWVVSKTEESYHKIYSIRLGG